MNERRREYEKTRAKERKARWIAANRGRYLEAARLRQRRYRARMGDVVKEQKRRSRIYKQYGLTEEQFQELVTLQSGLCAICNRSFSVVDQCVDHCHATGKVRGLLCRGCNSFLGAIQDDPAAAIRAANYLKSPPWDR